MERRLYGARLENCAKLRRCEETSTVLRLRRRQGRLRRARSLLASCADIVQREKVDRNSARILLVEARRANVVEQ